MLFLHETDGVVSKHGGSPLHIKGQQTGLIDFDVRNGLSNQAVGRHARRFGCLSTDDFALSYCYNRHILAPEVSSNTKLVVRDPALLSAMRALGMATLSQKEHTREIQDVACEYYVDAMRSLSSALMSRDTALLDSALISVMMLSIYE